MKQLHPHKHLSISKKQSQGFTLLEILVAIVVLSFGLLGMVGIQAMALKSNTDAKQQSTAVQLASELSEMMRGNKVIAVGLTNATNPYLVNNYTGGAISAPSENCSASAGCNSSLNVATWEAYEWLTRIKATFPGARVQVCYDPNPYTTAGTPQWGCAAAGAAKAGDSISIKIGWTRDTTNKTRVNTGNATTDATTNKTNAYDEAVRPSIIYIVTPGSST